jgi:hypothetical protein
MNSYAERKRSFVKSAKTDHPPAQRALSREALRSPPAVVQLAQVLAITAMATTVVFRVEAAHCDLAQKCGSETFLRGLLSSPSPPSLSLTISIVSPFPYPGDL